MKNLSALSAILLIIWIVLPQQYVNAQVPEKMSYQAVLRDASNKLVANQAVGMRISILQGSASGATVYVETQSPTTNTNGLVTIKIGLGSPVTGNFATINWANGTYFLKTETDPDNSINYTITGTSQLLSVPYALHAKTAERITNETVFNGWDKDESDDFNGQYNSLTGTPSNISEFTNDVGYITVFSEIDDDITNELQTISRSGLTVTLSDDGGSFQDSVNTYIAGQGIKITGNVIGIEAKHYVGEIYGGGIVFYVGHLCEHGLIASLDDLDGGSGVFWSDVTSVEIGVAAHNYYDGAANTDAIIAQQTATSAAQLCRNLGTEWYLPAIWELNVLYNAAFIINRILDNDGDANTNGLTIHETTPYGRYWSSNENSNTFAWYYEIREGRPNPYVKKTKYMVRGVKVF